MPARDFKANPESGPGPAQRYTAAGLRVVPINHTSKAAARKGFGRAFPEYSCPPEAFSADELVAILMGPCPLGTYAGGRWLMGFDLDGTWDRRELEERVGLLPDTLTSKAEKHLYYWLPPSLEGRDEITQTNDVFRTKKKQAGAVDWRPCAGGYFLERGDWDSGFDSTRIVDLPEPAWRFILHSRKKYAGAPVVPCKVPLGYGEPSALPDAALDALANQLAVLWPEPGAGGGHDLALALGGVLADAWISDDAAVEFCCRIWDGAAAPYQVHEVLTSMTLRRAPGRVRNVFGWPKLREILLEHNDPNDVNRVLSNLARRMPGLDPPKFLFNRPKAAT